ncbi:hypothetical protein D3C87_2172970 [compost metagenome]
MVELLGGDDAPGDQEGAEVHGLYGGAFRALLRSVGLQLLGLGAGGEGQGLVLRRQSVVSHG